MEELVPFSPYRSDRQYARLETYRRLGLPDATWAAEQFNLRVHVSTAGPEGAERRAAEVWEAVERLPLQVKDIVRGVIDEVRLDHEDSFPAETLGTWRDATMRINRDWSLIPALRNPGWHRDLGYDLLRATLVHEAGHALVEDPRGGIRLRDSVALIVASGWLPHPLGACVSKESRASAEWACPDALWLMTKPSGAGFGPGSGAAGFGRARHHVLATNLTRPLACRRVRLYAVVTRLHSPLAFSKPRNRNWRKPRLCLMNP